MVGAVTLRRRDTATVDVPHSPLASVCNSTHCGRKLVGPAAVLDVAYRRFCRMRVAYPNCCWLEERKRLR
jgi:hypothetical protein